ncbi:transglutaminase family protein, partial [bacterium]|nr:transglutaminase family protein [bacterium]
LGVSAKLTFPVYEDTFHYLWRENNLPIEIDPTDPKLDDPNERAMLISAFRNGLGTPVGYVMPLRRAWWQAQPGWLAGKWPVRSERVFLLPGESPIGLRLPLDTLPSESNASKEIYTTPIDPSAPRRPLTRPTEIPKGNEIEVLREETQEAASSRSMDGLDHSPINEQILNEERDALPDNEDDNVVQTALCVECRHGRLYVFLPPCQRVEDFLDLVSAVEETCKKLQLPVLIEGYPPPPRPSNRIIQGDP